ncbi:aminoglycoside phosphotransferase family protein [Nocardia amamiensis]|uniref:Aminoglycoside phosphotransferase family protein n=1 Tax=Nocardia amamiensis TaxID=404578 RepID=A0ABS0D555_9NOCA|nr:phosphotransferase [Nocardia amamiensis]MBF6302294.1 aminoglycoside phosphotransferase family protein [Nocardia amamiensis]
MARSSASAFLPDMVDKVLISACRAAGLDPADAVMLRLGENMLYQLAAAPVVVRIARNLQHWDDASKEVTVANWLAAQRFPAAQTYSIGDRSQPIEIDGHPVTFWRLIPGRAADLHETGILGELLHQLHQLDRPAGLTLPAVQAFGHVPARLATAPIPAADADFLRHRVRELEQELEALTFQLPVTALHGDAHVKNVMITDDGQAVLIDLEAFAFGPAEWDLAKTAAEASMGMLAERDYAAFAGSYGYDITTWSGWPILQAIQQVKMVSWLSQNVDHSARVRSEYDKRIRTLRTGRLTEPWRGL